MADTLFTYRELTRLFPVAEGTLRGWVSEDRITGYRRGRQKAYPYDDIHAAFTKRHPEPEDDTPWATGTSPSTDTAYTTTASTTTPSSV